MEVYTDEDSVLIVDPMYEYISLIMEKYDKQKIEAARRYLSERSELDSYLFDYHFYPKNILNFVEKFVKNNINVFRRIEGINSHYCKLSKAYLKYIESDSSLRKDFIDWFPTGFTNVVRSDTIEEVEKLDKVYDSLHDSFRFKIYKSLNSIARIDFHQQTIEVWSQKIENCSFEGDFKNWDDNYNFALTVKSVTVDQLNKIKNDLEKYNDPDFFNSLQLNFEQRSYGDYWFNLIDAYFHLCVLDSEDEQDRVDRIVDEFKSAIDKEFYTGDYSLKHCQSQL